MAITIKSFSPIQASDDFLNINKTKPELMFSSSYDELYVAVAVKHKYSNKIYFKYTGKLFGYNKDYRLNLKNFLEVNYKYKIIDVSTYLKSIQLKDYDYSDNVFILIDTVDVIAKNSAYIVTESSGEKYFLSTNYSSLSATEFKKLIRLAVYDKMPDYLSTYDFGYHELYTNSYYPFYLKAGVVTSLDITFYDSAGVAIPGYGTSGYASFEYDEYDEVLLAKVPSNAVKVYYHWSDNNGDDVDFIVPVKGCATNQYFYFNDRLIDAVYFTGKRETIESVEKEYIRNKPFKVTTTRSYEQNTGYFLPSGKLFELINSPFVFDLEKQYNILTDSAKGYNTRSLTERNDVITLGDMDEREKTVIYKQGFYD